MIPFLDLRRQHALLKSELMAALERVVDGSRFVLGGEGRALESLPCFPELTDAEVSEVIAAVKDACARA